MKTEFKFVGVNTNQPITNFKIVGFGEFENGSVLGLHGEIIKPSDKRWTKFKINDMEKIDLQTISITAEECVKLVENSVNQYEASELYDRIRHAACNGDRTLRIDKASLSKQARSELEKKGFHVANGFNTKTLINYFVIRW